MENHIIKRIFGYDLIKAVAMFLIVLYHFNSVDFGQVPESGWYIPNATKFFYAFCSAGVPLFFMVNGALTANKQTPLTKCIKKSVRLIFVAVIWTAIFTCTIYPLLYDRALPGIGEFQNYYWFLYTLAELYILSYIFNKFHQLKICVLAVLVVFPFITNFIWDILVAINLNRTVPNWGHTGVFTMYCIVYYYLGAYLSNKKINIAYSISILTIGLLLVNWEVIVMSTHYHKIYDGVNSCFPTIGALLISAGLFTMLKHVEFSSCEKCRSIISYIGKSTIGIYILHLFSIMIIQTYFYNAKTYEPYIMILLAVLLVLFLTGITQIILKSPIKFLLKT